MIGVSINWEAVIEYAPCNAGPDDMPAHIKSSVFGCALSYVPLISSILFMYFRISFYTIKIS